MQPITYSIIFNVLGAILAAGLAYVFQQPWLFVVVLMIQNHALERFRAEQHDAEPDFDDGQPMGFTADVK